MRGSWFRMHAHTLNQCCPRSQAGPCVPHSRCIGLIPDTASVRANPLKSDKSVGFIACCTRRASVQQFRSCARYVAIMMCASVCSDQLITISLQDSCSGLLSTQSTLSCDDSPAVANDKLPFTLELSIMHHLHRSSVQPASSARGGSW